MHPLDGPADPLGCAFCRQPAPRLNVGASGFDAVVG